MSTGGGARHSEAGPAAAPGPDALATPSPAESTGSRVDDWWAHALSTPGRIRAWRIGGPAAVLAVASLLRLVGLGHPHELVFDETYYVKDAYTLLRLGYEAKWPEHADAAFVAGDTDGYTTDPAFVAHPPLGKWVIALGLAALGPGDPVGWRIGTALAGILTVALVMLVAHLLFRSTLLTVVAGGLLAIDGNAIVMSRVALLDGILTLLVLAAFTAVLLDRRTALARLARWTAHGHRRGEPPRWGPAMWRRPWLLAAAVLLGLASSVKWSGLYFLAAFAVYTLVVDALARRRHGIRLWALGTLLRQAPVTFLLMIPVAAAVHLVSWAGWFASDGGYYRTWAEDSDAAWTGPLAWVPLSLQNWWHYQAEMYRYHHGENRPHSYQANPLTWLLLVRPTSMYYRSIPQGEEGCTAEVCASVITGVANPVIWWCSVAAALYLVYAAARRRDWRHGLILTGLAAGYLPWLLYTGRTVFQFYTIVFEPYLVLALTAAIGLILGGRGDPSWRRTSGIRVVAIVLGFSALVTAFFLPLWTGMPAPWTFVQLHYWLPTWR